LLINYSWVKFQVSFPLDFDVQKCYLASPGVDKSYLGTIASIACYYYFVQIFPIYICRILYIIYNKS